VTEITGQVNLDSWPQGSGLIIRRERLDPGTQFQIFEDHGYHHTAFLTDQPGDNIAALEMKHASAPASRTASAT
jgi:hypothetical protein